MNHQVNPEDGQDLTKQPLQHKIHAEAGRTKEKKDDGPWYKNYAEVVIGGTITAFLIGVVAWTFGHFATKIDHIEKTIAAHHGPEWEQIEKVVAIGQLRSEFIEAKKEYEHKLLSLSSELEKKITVINEVLKENTVLLKALEHWTTQGDNIVMASREREYEAYAHLTNLAPPEADVALINTAHIGGTRFNIGDDVVVTNTSSGRRENVTVKIVSAYTDLDNTDVLIQIAQQPANILGLSKTLGRIKVIVKKDKPDPNDPKRWKSFPELKNLYKL